MNTKTKEGGNDGGLPGHDIETEIGWEAGRMAGWKKTRGNNVNWLFKDYKKLMNCKPRGSWLRIRGWGYFLESHELTILMRFQPEFVLILKMFILKYINATTECYVWLIIPYTPHARNNCFATWHAKSLVFSISALSYTAKPYDKTSSQNGAGGMSSCVCVRAYVQHQVNAHRCLLK